MQPKNFLRRIILFLGAFALFAVFLVTFLYFFTRNLIQKEASLFIENIAAAPQDSQIKSVLPSRIKIPMIGVDALIEHTGLTPQGAMDVPDNPYNAAWFNRGPVPGGSGSAVISGHYGWKNNIPAVFDNLYKLKIGDEIYIENESGLITTFIVRDLRTYDQKDDASDVFGSSDGRAHLNLVTCKGVWDKIKKSYSQRLVVFSDKK